MLGAEKIRTILVQRGHQVSAEYVSRLMHEMGLSSVRTTAKQEYLKLREPERKKNILRQQFNAQQPNQRWVSDVTCFKLGEHYFYICVIIDLCISTEVLQVSSSHFLWYPNLTEEDIAMKYLNDEKLSIITRYQQGENVATLSDELDIPRSTLYRWLKSFPTDSAGKPLKFSYQEYATHA